MQRVASAQQQYQQQQDKHDSLTKLANYYKDPFVIESEARQQLGYVRPGERPVIIISSTSQQRPIVVHLSKTPCPAKLLAGMVERLLWQLTVL